MMHLDTGRAAAKTVSELAGLVPNPIRRIHVLAGYRSQTWADFRGRFAGSQQKYLHRHQVLMAGADAAQALASKLKELPLGQGDIVVIQRGGGPTATLAAFDDPITVAAIRECPVPVFTAIGHSNDVSACDQAATASYTTPTALGEALAKVVGRQFYHQQRTSNRPTPVTPQPTPRPIQPPVAYPPTLSQPAPPSPGIPTYPHSPLETRDVRVPDGPRPLGTASLVVGIITVLTFGGLGIGPLAGLMLGLFALRKPPRGRAIIGICLSTLGMGMFFVAVLYWVATRH